MRVEPDLVGAPASLAERVLVEVVVPVYNEASGLEASIRLPLVAPLVSGHSHLAVGSRLAPGARVVRGPRREFISRAYNLILRSVLHLGVRDAQCGFKAVRTDALQILLPEVEDNSWFFDTELLVRAQRAGLRIVELPVDWIDDPDSRVDIVRTALDDLRGVCRLLRQRRPVGVGAVCTLLALLGLLAVVVR